MKQWYALYVFLDSYTHDSRFLVFCSDLVLVDFAHICQSYHQTSNISGTLVGNKVVDHPDVVGASPVGAAPSTRSETYFRQDLFPAYLFFRRQFHAIVIFRFKSFSDLDSGEFIYAILKIMVSQQGLDVKWPEIRSPVDRVRVRARVRLGLISNSVSSG